MQTNFFVLCGATVPQNYTWDLGAPLQFAGIISDATTTTLGITGFAPALNVVFYNDSFSDNGFDFVEYAWDFGDFYNDANNFVSLSCASLVQHTYIMPGTYTVTLKHIQSRGRGVLDQTGNDLLCRSKYGIRWFWDELLCVNPITSSTNINAIKWEQTECVPPTNVVNRSKWWANEIACFQKYCKIWSWYDLGTDRANPVRWFEAETDQKFQKKWMYEANDTVCSVNNASFLNTVETQEQTTIKTMIVTVNEIPPVASMFSVSAVVGSSPLTVRLSPRNCKPGSFPIDRIDWDFGDGTPIKTVTRYTRPQDDDPTIFNTGYFITDLDDIRNFDVIHTYARTKDVYPVFYPSLTCYSANTNTTDSCCITIGPISFAEIPTDIHLIKSRNTNKGNVYVFSDENKVTFTTTGVTAPSLIPPQPTIPPLVIRDGRGIPQPYFGHPNDNNQFPGVYVPDCTFQALILPGRYIITENPVTYGAQPEDEVPIKTEADFFISP